MTSNISLIYTATVDGSQNPSKYSFGKGGRYNTRTQAARAYKRDKDLEGGKRIGNINKIVKQANPKKRDLTFTFLVNPESLTITEPTSTIRSQFVDLDGGIVRAVQLGFRTVSGQGKFIDSSEKTAQEQYAELREIQRKKIPVRFFGPGSVANNVGSFYIIIESLTINYTSAVNAINFNFSFVETKLRDSVKTGFEIKRSINNSPSTDRETSSNPSYENQYKNPQSTTEKDEENPDDTLRTIKALQKFIINQWKLSDGRTQIRDAINETFQRSLVFYDGLSAGTANIKKLKRERNSIISDLQSNLEILFNDELKDISVATSPQWKGFIHIKNDITSKFNKQ